MPVSPKSLWTGRVLSALVVLFMLFDTTLHLLEPQVVVDAFNRLGYNPDLSRPIALVELLCVVLCAIPRTAVWGAVLLTGYLGGAVATQLRAGSPFVGETLFPVYVGILLWGGLVLRDRRVRALLLPGRAAGS
jgi:DoxX-like family